MHRPPRPHPTRPPVRSRDSPHGPTPLRPTTLVLTVEGDDRIRELSFPGAVTEHRVPLVELRPGALGNADLLPLTGNRLGTWGTGPRIVEFAEDTTVVFEVTLPMDLTVDRAIRIPSLYPPGVVVRER